MDEQIESWQNQIRNIAPVMQMADFELLKAEADVKRVLALWKTVALSEGIKTTSAQDTYAENQSELYQSRLAVAVAKGQLSAVKVQLRALEVGFEEWRTKMVNAREERKRYGA
tara:strand:- start:165 stop:503 length:339 start_codon:yes stop_codon:yes gene_type:complete